MQFAQEMGDMINNLMKFFPRTWRVRREKEIAEATTIKARLSSLEPSAQFLAKTGFPSRCGLGRRFATQWCA